jgi:SAM-dependent methyltransferase
MSDTLGETGHPGASSACCDKTSCCGGSHSPGEVQWTDIKDVVREKYGEAARRAAIGQKSSCCDTSTCCGGTHAADPMTSDLYDAHQTDSLPDAAVRASLGCGNPTALAELRAGEVVLDLGCGGGIDVLLSARRVGPKGKAYGLDMTDEMLELARRNQAEARVTNVEFLRGEIEAIPLPDASVDVIISNCVINLSANKDRVLSEAFRVLKPGGRFAVSDVVVRGPVPDDIRKNVELWVGCVAGAMEESEYVTKLERQGFTTVSVEPTRIYDLSEAREFLQAKGVDPEAAAQQADGKFMSASSVRESRCRSHPESDVSRHRHKSPCHSTRSSPWLVWLQPRSQP